MNPGMICGRCDQKRRGLPLTLPEHFASCPERTTPVPEQQPLTEVYMWLAKPHIGLEHLLMVLVDDPDAGQPVYRPLMALDLDTAVALHEVAGQAAADLNVSAVLRHYSTDGTPLDVVIP